VAGQTASGESLTQLYRNDGVGPERYFTAVSVQPSDLGGVYLAAVKWADFDGDGDVDILLSGLNAEADDAPLAALYRNDGAGTGDGWTFTAITVQPAGLTDVGESAVDWGDY